jgi:hypothetical protein
MNAQPSGKGDCFYCNITSFMFHQLSERLSFSKVEFSELPKSTAAAMCIGHASIRTR